VINKPLTILGAEQKLFFTALIMDAAAFNLFGSLLVFGSLFLMAQWATRTNPQILRILLNSNKFGREYDSAKYSDPNVRGFTMLRLSNISCCVLVTRR
jgi:hypothetical protein